MCDDRDNCPTTPNSDQVDDESDGFGNAILSRTPLADIRRVKLPLLAPANEPRGLLVAKTTVGGRTVALACAGVLVLSGLIEWRIRARRVSLS